MHCARPQDYHSLGLTRIQFHPPKVTPLTNSAKVTDQGLSYCTSDTWGWRDSHQSGVISCWKILRCVTIVIIVRFTCRVL